MLELKESLKQSGVNPEETSIDFENQSSITTKQHEEITTLRQEQVKKCLNKLREDRIPSFDISNFEETKGGENLQEDVSRLQEKGLDVTIDDLENSYTNDEEPFKLNPYFLEFDSLNYLLDFAVNEINEKNAGKAILLERMLSTDLEDYNTEVWSEWFENPQADLDYFNSNALEDVELNVTNHNRPIEQFIDEYWEDLKDERSLENPLLYQEAVALDLVKSLQGLALNKDDEFKERVDSFEDFFSNYDPVSYNDVGSVIDPYEVKPISSREQSESVSNIVGSCLKDEKVDEAHWMYMEDPFTFVQGIFKNELLEGYVRSFVMEDSEENYFLGIDTIEVPKSPGMDIEDVEDDFEERSDIVQAGAMGAIALAQDLDLSYVAGRDGRVRFGVRQGYGNTDRNITYRKLGDTVPYYCVAPAFYDEEKDKMLPRDEELYGESDLKSLRCPGFKVYHKPGEQEVRGFQTEPGWHENTAYILFENPEKF